MRNFEDEEGQNWEIVLTIASAKRVRDLLQVNLLELDQGEPPLIARLTSDVILLIDVIFCLVKPQADKLKISDEQFAEGLGGEAAERATKAFLEELADFFRGLGREEMAQAIERAQEVIRLGVKKAAEQIAAMDLEGELDRILGGSSTSSPGSPE